MTFRVFTRAWWRKNPDWPDGREPHAGRKRTRAIVQTETEARAWCAEYNATHDPGPLSVKAEYEATE